MMCLIIGTLYIEIPNTFNRAFEKTAVIQVCYDSDCAHSSLHPSSIKCTHSDETIAHQQRLSILLFRMYIVSRVHTDNDVVGLAQIARLPITSFSGSVVEAFMNIYPSRTF